MSMFDSYKNRLYGKIQENPELALMNNSIARLSSPAQEMNNRMQSMLMQKNASPGAVVAATLRGNMQLQDERSAIFSTALDAFETRQKGLMDQLGDVSMKEAEYDQQMKDEKAQKQTNALRTGLQIAGLAAGAALAAPTGGMSLLAGASIGGGIGQVVGGFMGIDKSGNFSVQPKDWDTEAIMTGAAGAISAYASHLDEKNMAEITTTIGNTLSTPEARAIIKDMPLDEFINLTSMINGAALRGDKPGVETLLQRFAVGDTPTLSTKDQIFLSAKEAVNNYKRPAIEGSILPQPVATDTPTMSDNPNTNEQNIANFNTNFTQAIQSDPQAKTYNSIYEKYKTMTDADFQKWFKSKGYKKGTYEKFIAYLDQAQGVSK